MTSPALPPTLVHQLLAQADRLGPRPALWTKKNGSWSAVSWRAYADEVKRFALGLAAMGFEQGDVLAVMAFSRREWLVAQLGAMALGGRVVGIYTTSSADQMAYVLSHCEAAFMLVENADYAERVQHIEVQVPTLRHKITLENTASQPGFVRFDDVVAKGEKADQRLFFERLEVQKPSDLAALIYTSGTTGHPKGVMLSHHNLTWTSHQMVSIAKPTADDVLLSYLPLSHIAEQVLTIYCPLFSGTQVYFASSFEALGAELKEVRPTIFFGVPRVWEKFKAKAEGSFAALPKPKRMLLNWAQSRATEYHQSALSNRPRSIVLSTEYRLAQRLVFGPLKARIGLNRCRLTATAAAPISKEVLDFFASIDLILRETYGQSEVTGPTSVSTETATRLGALGRPMQGVEVRIADDGEILVRGDNVCMGYYKNPAATDELLQDGWLHSGDLGKFDDDGYLLVTGRKKEIIVTSTGKKTSPALIEAKLKDISPIGNALVHGDNRNYLVALLTLDADKVATHEAASTFGKTAAEVAASPQFLAFLRQEIEAKVNATLSRFETIKRFHVLPADFSVEGGELTSTLKLRRKVCEDKYRTQLDALYHQSPEAAAT
jgi:long-chain acyl-CoA synthetase